MVTKQKQTEVKSPEAQEIPEANIAIYAGGAVVVAGDARPDWIGTGARGSENVQVEDVAIPRLEVVQMLSPIAKDNPELVGQLYNSVTGDIYGNSALFVPVVFIKQWLLWKLRKHGGGFRGAFTTPQEAQERLDQIVSDDNENPKQFEIAETPSHFGLLVTKNGLIEVVISMPRSKQKVSRKLNSLVQLAGGDRFSRVYEIGVIEDKNTKGDKFMNLHIRVAGFASQTVYAAAEKVYEKVRRGFTVAHESVAGGDQNGDSEIA